MSLLFADIYDGIRCIRITKGVSEKDILNFVQDKVGGCMKVGNVLKTIRTLKKLVDDGVLMRKGKRYTFAPKCNKKEKEEEEDDEEDNENECEEMSPVFNDECDEDDGDDDDQNDDEEDEEDDDDDDEEDDDDEDDEDEDCNDQEGEPEGDDNMLEDGSKACSLNETQVKSKESCNGKNQNVGNNNAELDGNNNNDDSNNNSNSNSNSNNNVNCLEKKVNRALTCDGKKSSRKSSKDKPEMDQEGGDGTNKNNEAIAFCVRDFIDSLGRPDNKDQENPQKSEATLQENMDATKTLEFGREFSMRKRSFRSKRNAPGRGSGRSRSPIKEVQAELYHCFGSDNNEMGVISSEMFKEPADAEMEIDLEKDDEIAGHHRTPSSSNIHAIDRIESCYHDSNQKSHDTVKIDHSFDGFTDNLAKKASQMSQVQTNECNLAQMTWYPLEEVENGHETQKRNSSDEDERNEDRNDDEKSVSLCSVCEKKKRNS